MPARPTEANSGGEPHLTRGVLSPVPRPDQLVQPTLLGGGTPVRADFQHRRMLRNEAGAAFKEFILQYPVLGVMELMEDYRAAFQPSPRIERPAAVRGLLNIPETAIRLAGGYPPPEAFPSKAFVQELTNALDTHFGIERLSQYGSTEGFMPLREVLVPTMQERGVTVHDASEVLIGTGSQQLLHGIAEALLKTELPDGSFRFGGKVAVEAPTYIGALDAFDAHGASYVHIPKDVNGIIIPSELDRMLTEGELRGGADQIKFIYLAPTFQNPTGVTMPIETRKQVAEVVKKHGVVLVEDDPYGDLRYEGTPLPPIQSFAPDNTVYVSTFSKTFMPGARVGYGVFPPTLRDTVAKGFLKDQQSSVLFTSFLTQGLAYEYVKGGHMAADMPKKQAIYKTKRDALYDELAQQQLPEGLRVNKPEGGMFLYMELPHGVDAEAFAAELAKVEGPDDEFVAVVPVRGFYGDLSQAQTNGIRICFTTETEDRLRFAARKIGKVAQRMVA